MDPNRAFASGGLTRNFSPLNPQLQNYNQYVGNVSSGQSPWAPQNTQLYTQSTQPTSNFPAPAPGPSGVLGTNTGPVQGPQQPNDPYASLRNEISSNWDNFLNSLGGMEEGLLGQRTAQENIAQSQLKQGEAALNTSKTKSLRDISENIRNAFQAGNTYLGSLGAGDSSAANQYSYALNKEAGRQTANLNEFVNTQMQNLKSTTDQQMNSIAAWFSEAQNQLKQQIAEGRLSKGKDLESLSSQILNQAIAATNQINQNATNRYNALMSWATNNAGSLQGLQQSIASIPEPVAQPTVDSMGNFRAPTGYGQQEQQKDIFGNPIG